MIAPITSQEKPIPIANAPHHGRGANRPMDNSPTSSAKWAPTAMAVAPVNNVLKYAN